MDDDDTTRDMLCNTQLSDADELSHISGYDTTLTVPAVQHGTPSNIIDRITHSHESMVAQFTDHIVKIYAFDQTDIIELLERFNNNILEINSLGN